MTQLELFTELLNLLRQDRYINYLHELVRNSYTVERALEQVSLADKYLNNRAKFYALYSCANLQTRMELARVLWNLLLADTVYPYQELEVCCDEC